MEKEDKNRQKKVFSLLLKLYIIVCLGDGRIASEVNDPSPPHPLYQYLPPECSQDFIQKFWLMHEGS